MTEQHDKLEKRLRAQRKELAKLQAFYERHKRGEPQPEPGFVRPEDYAEALSGLIYEREKRRDKEIMLSPIWWKHQNIIDGMKTALTQVYAVAGGFGANFGKKAERRKRWQRKQEAEPKLRE